MKVIRIVVDELPESCNGDCIVYHYASHVCRAISLDAGSRKCPDTGRRSDCPLVVGNVLKLGACTGITVKWNDGYFEIHKASDG